MTRKHIQRGWYERSNGEKVFLRSKWEINFAAYLDWLVGLGEIKGWRYEPTEFEFHAVKRGTRYYKPDFQVINHDGSVVWYEVKGRWTQKAKTQVNRFRKYYPDEKLIIVDADAYKAIARSCGNLVTGWR